MSEEPAWAHLEVDRATLVDALKRFAKATRFKGDMEAVLSFEDGWLEFRIGGEAASVAAEGRWHGEARVSAALLRSLSTQPASAGAQPQVQIRVVGDRIIAAGHSVRCAWQPAGAATIEIKTGSTLLEVLLATMHASDLEIERSGISSKVTEARRQKLALVKRAAAVLKPLGIGESQVAEFVDTALRIKP